MAAPAQTPESPFISLQPFKLLVEPSKDFYFKPDIMEVYPGAPLYEQVFERDPETQEILKNEEGHMIPEYVRSNGEIVRDEVTGLPLHTNRREWVMYCTIKLIEKKADGGTITEENTKRFPANFTLIIKGYNLDGTAQFDQGEMAKLIGIFNLNLR